MPTLGKILKGCDRLAEDAMSIEHPIFRDLELPIVSCERGFGGANNKARCYFSR
jgi:hypothetical protein